MRITVPTCPILGGAPPGAAYKCRHRFILIAIRAARESLLNNSCPILALCRQGGFFGQFASRDWDECHGKWGNASICEPRYLKGRDSLFLIFTISHSITCKVPNFYIQS